MAKTGGFLEPASRCLEPPQHGPLGWLTTPPSVDILRRSAPPRFRFYVGAYPQQRPIEISDSPFGFVRRTAETYPRWWIMIKGRAFLPSLMGAASRAPIG